MNILYTTQKKLMLFDSKGNRIQFESSFGDQETESENEQLNDEDDDALEFHVLRFETYTENYDWILTDMDYALEGNPYFTEEI